MENNEIIIHIKYIISNRHVEITYDFPLNNILVDTILYIKNKFEKSFKDEKQIWEDYKYIHNKEIKLIYRDSFLSYQDDFLEQLESHFNSIYEDAKKVYERRNIKCLKN
jgi:hypothetical protein